MLFKVRIRGLHLFKMAQNRNRCIARAFIGDGFGHQ